MSIQNSKKEISALVVDDNKTDRTINQALLKQVGVKNQAVTNGSEVVQLYLEGQHFDLIIMDWDMPIMNGLEATKQLRSMGVDSIILGLSSRSSSKEIKEFMNAGANHCAVKPLSIGKLSAIVDEVKRK